LTLKQNRKQDLSDVYISRGNAYLRRGGPGDNEQAIKEYDKALVRNLYDPEVYFNRGLAHQNSRQDQLPIAHYKKAYTLSLDKAEYSAINLDAANRLRGLQANQTSLTQIRRGDAFLKRGGPRDNEQAITAYTQALERIQYDPGVYLNRGVA